MLLLDTMDNNPRKRLSSSTTKGKEQLPAARVSSTRLRSNLLTKLGIPPSYSPASLKLHQKQQQPSAISLLANAKIQRIPLKTCDEMDTKACSSAAAAAPPSSLLRGSSSSSCQTDNVFQAWGSLWATKPQQQQQSGSLSSQTTTNTTTTSCSMMSIDGNDTTTSTRRHVHFNNDVQVTLIPTRHEYSNRIRKFLWDPPSVMQRNIIINTLEFTADGWNGQDVLEESEHYYNPTTNEYIHPVHLEIAQMSPEERDDVCPPNYINPALALSSRSTSS